MLGYLKNKISEVINRMPIFTKKYWYVDFDTLCQSKCLKKKLNITFSKVFYATPRYSFEEKSIIYNAQKRNYVLLLEDVSVFSDSDIILLTNHCALLELKDIFTEENLIEYEDQIIYKDYGKYCKICNQQRKISIESAIYMGGKFSWNYYHFTYLILSKSFFIKSIDSSIPIMLEECVYNNENMRQLINIFFGNRTIITTHSNTKYFVKQLYVISQPNVIVPNYKSKVKIKANHCIFDYDVLGYMREKMLKEIVKDKYKETPHYIYISRKNASNRRKYNDAEVECWLKSKGFITIYPENLSIYEQVLYFYNADVIIGGSGAAFTNLLYCKENCKVIILTNYKYDISLFSSIAAYNKLNCIYLVDKSSNLIVTADKLHDQFTVNFNDLSDLLAAI